MPGPSFKPDDPLTGDGPHAFAGKHIGIHGLGTLWTELVVHPTGLGSGGTYTLRVPRPGDDMNDGTTWEAKATAVAGGTATTLTDLDVDAVYLSYSLGSGSDPKTYFLARREPVN